MTLINALMSLKQDGVVKNFSMMGREKAVANLINGESLILFMPYDYIIGATAIKESVVRGPRPDYIVYNDWSKIVDNAEEEAHKLKIPLVKFGRLRYILDELLSK